MGTGAEVPLTYVLGALPLLGLLLWWWNELWYVVSLKFRLLLAGNTAKLPPGHMGLPIIGEMFSFLWHFKIARRPDDFIDSKRRRYGDGVGLYRTHLFGSPSIIACFPDVNKFILQSDDVFRLVWPNLDIVGHSSIIAVRGKAHDRLRMYLTNAINSPDALRRIAAHVQPRMVAALESWVQRGRINTLKETKKLTFENIGKLFASFEPGPILEVMDKLFYGLMKGFRAHPFKIPGTTHYHAIQCRKKLEEIFRVELEKKKKNHQNGVEKENDLMDGLMQMKDEEGNQLKDQEVLDNIVTLVFAGYESTSIATMWAVYHLAKHPDVLNKLREENMDLSKTKNGNFITSEDVSKMDYTSKVVEEMLRLANISAMVFRSVSKEVEYKGYVIPKDWKVIVWQRYLHTNPEDFEDPMCFNPDRWNTMARPGTYQVFGGGARICAGNRLARMQLALFLHHLSTGYRWELLNPDAAMKYLPHPAPVDGTEIAISKL